jgi:DNA-binding response OmpR family regulator
LLVEDNIALNEGNRRSLEAAGYDVMAAHTVKEARECLTRRKPDVILLDILLPDGSGIDFCAEIRPETNAHIIFLTSRGEHEDQLRGMSLGGDDYITKPFKLDIMLARVSAAMRRRRMDAAAVKTIVKGSLRLEIISGRAYVDGVDLLLQPKEFSMLRLFAENENRLLSAEEIYEKAWRMPMIDNKTAIQTAISRLRKKMESTDYTITVIYAKGYVFEHI